MDENGGFWRGCFTAVGLMTAVGFVLALFAFMSGNISLPQLLDKLPGARGAQSAETLPNGGLVLEEEQTTPATSRSPASTISPQLVSFEKTGTETRKTYEVTLSSNEAIVGDAYDFQDKGYTCVVFLIRGPGSFSFAVLDGAWYQYSGVMTSSQAEELLQGRTQYLQNHWFCKNVPVPIERLGN